MYSIVLLSMQKTKQMVLGDAYCLVYNESVCVYGAYAEGLWFVVWFDGCYDALKSSLLRLNRGAVFSI